MITIAKPIIENEEKKAVQTVLESGILAQGPKVREFENKFAEYIGVNHAVAVSSGTTALHITLLAHGIGEGDEVITSPFSFIATANSILYTQAKPVFVDIEPKGLMLDSAQIEQAITTNTRAILPVHLYGQCCDMETITEIAKHHNLAIIEDACQSHGATNKNIKAGAFGTGTFSFYPTKNMTCGEGGMITTDDEEIAEKCRVIRNHGMRRRYYHDEIGFNFRMTDISAAIGLEQLKKIDAFNSVRRENAAYFNKHLRGVVTPEEFSDRKHVYHQYTIRVHANKRDALRSYLKEHGIGAEVYYPVPIHEQSYIVDQGLNDREYPESQKAALEVLSIPVHPSVTKSDRQQIVERINAFMGCAA